MLSNTLSRKKFLSLLTAAGAATWLGGCDALTTDPDTGGGSGSSGSGDNGPEAPALAELVESGDLPAVEERLPKEPRVIEPVETVGRYGGTWETALESSDPGWLYMTMRYDTRLVGWDPEWKEIIPILAESYEILEEGRRFHFVLREGLKWSDGKPFTTDDIVFWHDAELVNEEITPVVGPQWGDDGEPLTVEKIDDYQVDFVFKNPHGLFLQELAWFWLAYDIPVPRHYLEEFHPDFNPNVDALVAEAGFDSWSEFYLQKRDRFENVDLPVLTPWRPTGAFSDGGRMTWERNPYYWSVDTEGSQLPYLDQVRFTIFSDPESVILACANGDVSMYMRTETTTPQNKPVLAQSMETGGYTLMNLNNSDLNTMGICLNLTNNNQVKRQLYQNKDFRIGLSHAINRQQIIDTVHQRQGRPWQTAPRPEAPFYDSDDMGTQYTEFDVDLANEHLDRAGLTERDGNGMRLGPDGERLVVAVLTPTRYVLMIDALELIKATWAEVGVELRIDAVDPSLVSERIEANEFDCTVDAGQLGYMDMIRDPRWLFSSSGNSMYAPLWVNWYTGATPSEEPPEAMLQAMQIYREEVFEQPALEDMFDGMRQLIEIARDEFWSIGVSLPEGFYAVRKNTFRNVPEDMWLAFMYPGVTNVSQYFSEEG